MFKRAIWDNIYRVHFFEILKSPDFKSSKNERGKFSPNFTNKTCDSWLITCDQLSKSTQG